MGGAAAAIEQGFYQREIERSAYEAQKRIESGDDVIVGAQPVHASRSPSRRRRSTLDPATEARAVARVRAFRAARDGGGGEAPRSTRSPRRAPDAENLVPRVLACVEAKATLGEIMQTLEDRFGRYEGR